MMDADDRVALESRLRKLERSCRRMRLGLTGVGCAAVLLGLGAWTAQEAHTLEAERFVIRDSHGNVQGFLGMTSKGGVELSLGTPGGSGEAHLGVHPKIGSGLRLGGSASGPLVNITATAETAGVQLIAPSRKAHLILRARDPMAGIQAKVAENVATWP